MWVTYYGCLCNMCMQYQRTFNFSGTHAMSGHVEHVIYTAADHSNELARPNYDLYWMTLATGKTTRVTFASDSKFEVCSKPLSSSVEL